MEGAVGGGSNDVGRKVEERSLVCVSMIDWLMFVATSINVCTAIFICSPKMLLSGVVAVAVAWEEEEEEGNSLIP